MPIYQSKEKVEAIQLTKKDFKEVVKFIRPWRYRWQGEYFRFGAVEDIRSDRPALIEAGDYIIKTKDGLRGMGQREFDRKYKLIQVAAS